MGDMAMTRFDRQASGGQQHEVGVRRLTFCSRLFPALAALIILACSAVAQSTRCDEGFLAGRAEKGGIQLAGVQRHQLRSIRRARRSTFALLRSIAVRQICRNADHAPVYAVRFAILLLSRTGAAYPVISDSSATRLGMISVAPRCSISRRFLNPANSRLTVSRVVPIIWPISSWVRATVS